MPRPLTALFVLACALAASSAHPAELWRDDFHSARTYERWGPRCWTLTNNEMRFSTGETGAWLVPQVDDLRDVTAWARMSVAKRIGTGYVFGGLILLGDQTNHWQLMLVESPEGHRYFELVEQLSGVHQAQLGTDLPGARLTGADTGDLKTWEYQTPYELDLKLTSRGTGDPARQPALVGTVTDPRTGNFWRRTYDLTGGRAVKEGRPGLTVTGLAGAFSAFTMDGPPPSEGTAWNLPTGRLGTVAIIADESGALGKQWADAFTHEGYGALTVSWDDLLRGRLPVSRLDVLVLADARRVPLEAREAVKGALRSAGKVIAIGAPAFMELLAHTARGWVGPEGYSESLYGELKAVPVPLSGEWQRGAQHPEKHSVIERAPDEGQDAWKLSFDYDGWDGFRTSIPGAFADGRSLLTFWARGDEATPQLLVECGEKDKSRWIATVPLTTEWRPYVLRAQDFPYWKDSPAQRGQPGDRFRPENVEGITFGLAASHTAKVKPGPHTLWIRQLASAADPGGEDLDFSVPEIEALSPSYKLFPLKTPVTLSPGREQAALGVDAGLTWRGEAYSPIWRERGRGWNRERSWRWIPLLEARDDQGQHRGALLSLMIGDAVSPDAMWANLGVADPQAALADPRLREAVLSAAQAMTRGCFLLEGGAPYFSCEPGEELTLGAEAVNAGRSARKLTLTADIVAQASGDGKVAQASLPAVVAQASTPADLAPHTRTIATWRDSAPRTPGVYTVTVTLREGNEVRDRIVHSLVVGPRRKPTADDFVRVEGSGFTLGGKPWYFKGINYWPTWVGGYRHLGLASRECYDPEIIERDLSWLQSAGFNAISAVQGLQPPDPKAPGAFRDQLDFLDRCQRHGIKVFFFLPNARPFAGANAQWVKQYLDRAGIKDHPAVMCWELAWEPIHGAWGNPSGLLFIQDAWNAWVIQRYGSVENAIADWGFRPEMAAGGKLPVPTHEMTTTHGPWDPMVAAFRRAWSDTFSQAYGAIVNDLRAYDPQHLISFRFGACSIPAGQAFAHAHSVGVLKHVDFMNPEGYSLMTSWTTVTPADDWRKGGVITLYFRHFSGEKPVVWMEFGYTVNGISDPWAQPRLHIKPEELANQKAAYEALYGMFIESGARGAAPWWLPGGFRLGENSDFGVLDPDGSERPVCEVIRKYLPRFDQVRHDPPTAYLDFDLDAHYADAWQTYSNEYLRLVKAGERPAIRTAGTGTTSADCPLTAAGNRPYSGHNPPIHLNAEFNSLEIRSGAGPWQPVTEGEVIEVAAGQPVSCRASVGNLAEAKWLAPRPRSAGDLARGREGQPGGVYLAGRKEYGLEFAAPIAADTPFLKDATVKEFVLLPRASGEVTLSCEMTAQGRAYFGERRTVKLKAR